MSPPSRRRWFVVVASALPVALLGVIDLGLRGAGVVAPPDPALRYRSSFDKAFSPLVDDGQGSLTIPAEWIARDGFRQQTVAHAGQFFIYPGFRPVTIKKVKPAGTLRIFSLGGSTTFGLHVGAEGAFTARLAAGLRERLPGRSIEAINLGCPGWASDRELNLLDVVLGLEPDLVILYSGHNEMLDPVSALRAEPSSGARLRAGVARVSTLFGWLDHAIRAKRLGGKVEEWREDAIRDEATRHQVSDPLLVRMEKRVEVSDSYREAAARAFAANLAAMVARAADRKVPLLLPLPVANLAAPPAPPGRRDAAVAALLTQARGEFAAGAIATAEQLLARAVAAAPYDAELRFLHGTALWHLARRDEGRAELRRAVDLDIKTNRITTPLEAAFQRIVESTGQPWVDLRPIFHDDLGQASVESLFIDHCHPTALGHQKIADAMLPVAVALLRDR